MRITGKVKLDTKVLEKLQAELDNGKGGRVKVGVLASRAERPDGSELNNADIGAVHELGSEEGGIPRRSFLEMPITTKLPASLKKIKKAKLIKVIVEQGLGKALGMLGVLGEQVVDEAFATRGHGTWAPNSEATKERKGSDAPLIDKVFLRKSITSKVYLQGDNK